MESKPWGWKRIIAVVIMSPFAVVFILVMSPLIAIAGGISLLEWVFCTAFGVDSKQNSFFDEE